MNVPFYIARRYLFAKKSRNVINIISMISMIVVAFVTAAMIAVLSAFSGIEDLVKGLFGNFDAPITLVPETGKTFPDSLVTSEWLSGFPEIVYYSRIIEEDAWIEYSGSSAVATIKGVEAGYTSMAPIDSMIYTGRFDIMSDSIPGAVLGLGLRSELLIPVSETNPAILQINAPIRGKKLSRYRENAFNREYIQVTGAFSANAELDAKYVFVPLSFARELFGMKGEISAIEINLKDNIDSEIFKSQLDTRLPQGIKAISRYDKNALIYRTNATEKWATFLILLFILIIACFNIIASLTMLIIEKKRDIYVLGSLGMTPTSLRKVFITEGILINVTGAVLGTIVGLTLCLLQQHVGLITMNGAVVEYYPVTIKVWDVIGIFLTVVFVGSIFCSLLVRSLMARFAWNRHPV